MINTKNLSNLLGRVVIENLDQAIEIQEPSYSLGLLPRRCCKYWGSMMEQPKQKAQELLDAADR